MFFICLLLPLDPSFPATPIEFFTPNQILSPETVQSSLSLTCTVTNNGTFIWSWSGPGVNKAVTKLTDTTRTSVLIVSNISSNDAGVYTCTASYLGFGDISANFYFPGFNEIIPMTTSNTVNLTLNGN